MTYQPLDSVCVSFQPIETDESAKKPDQQKLALSSEEEREAITQLEGAIAARHVSPGDCLVRSWGSNICSSSHRLSKMSLRKALEVRYCVCSKLLF